MSNDMDTNDNLTTYRRAADYLTAYVRDNNFQLPNVTEKLNDLQKTFKERYAPDKLAALSDEELLDSVFFTAGDNKDSLCCWIEMNKECKSYYGSISGGSAFKFGLFQSKDSGVWLSGSSRKQIELSSEEALVLGKEIRDALVKGAEIIQKATLDSLEAYEKMNRNLVEAIGQKISSWSWIHKYFSIAFSDKLSSFHSDDLQLHVLRALRIKPSEYYYARSGQIAMVQNLAEWNYVEFFSAFKDCFGDSLQFFRLGTSDGTNNYAAEWARQGIIGIGWSKLGDLSKYVSKDGFDTKTVQENLEKEYYPENKSIASRKAGEIARFYQMNNNSIVVLMDGQKLIAMADHIGDYAYDPVSRMAHHKDAEWKFLFDMGETLPEKSEGKLTSCCQIKDMQNLEFLYDKYYYGENKGNYLTLKEKELPSSMNLEEDDLFSDPNNSSLPSEDWFPSEEEYTPGFSKEKWLEILNNRNIIGPLWSGALAAFYEEGGAATCTQIAERYNKNASSIAGNCTQLAMRIHKVTNCPLSTRKNGKVRYWSILFQGKNAGPDIPGGYIWKLRPELYEALTEYDILRYRWKEDSSDESVETIDPTKFNTIGNPQKRWIYPLILAIRSLGGTASRPDVYNWIFENYFSSDDEELQGGRIDKLKKEIDFARNTLNYEGFLDSNAPHGIWQLNSLGEKIVISEQLAGMIIGKWNRIKAADREGKPRPIIDLSLYYEYTEETESSFESYTDDDFLKEVFMTQKSFRSLKSLLCHKKNIILQGAPGVGKTFTAKRLAYAMMGEIDESRIDFIQFHQNYSYEDFVVGYKPSDDGFVLKEGVFYRACQKAIRHPEKDFFFIIDEINRGNLSKIFGELLMLIEADYRGHKATLAYGGELTVPKNLYIIGMMNTADRSLSLIDYALRRRFSFFDMNPGFETTGFKEMQERFSNNTFDRLIIKVKELNKAIRQDDSLGSGFQIGHSYFCGKNCTEEWLREIVYYDLIPTLQEYWFDDRKNLDRWITELTGVFDDK